MVVVPGKVLVIGLVPLVLDGVWLALAIVASAHKMATTSSQTQRRNCRAGHAETGCVGALHRIHATGIARNCFINDKQCRCSAGFDM